MKLLLEQGGREQLNEARSQIVRLRNDLRTAPGYHGTELEDLRGWKQSAMTVLAQWDQVYEALGWPGQVGESKAMAALAQVRLLNAAPAPSTDSDESRQEPLGGVDSAGSEVAVLQRDPAAAESPADTGEGSK